MYRIKNIIHADDVYKNGFSGKGIGVAILDTGIDDLHPDLSGRVICFVDFISHKSICYDDNGHGTHIAGIICGNGKNCKNKYSGIAKNANLIILKVLDQKGNGSTDSVIKALDFIKEFYRKYNIRIINFSIGYLSDSDIMEQNRLISKLEELWQLGIVVVTAAGNNGPKENSVTTPGISRMLITVGALDDEKHKYSGIGPTSCCVVKPEILAPGTKIISTKNDHHGYFVKTGTSMATPVVSGAIALLLEKAPKLTPEEIKILLYESVIPLQEKDPRNCWGILNVDRLLELV